MVSGSAMIRVSELIGQADGDEQGRAELGRVVVQRLPAEQLVADFGVRVGQLEGGPDERLVDRPLGDGGGSGRRQPHRGVAPEVVTGAVADGQHRHEHKASAGVADADRRRRVDPAVDRYLPDPPLAQRQPDGRDDQRVEPGQQEHHREFPDGVDVLHHAVRLAGAAGHLDREGDAGQQRGEQREVVRMEVEVDRRRRPSSPDNRRSQPATARSAVWTQSRSANLGHAATRGGTRCWARDPSDLLDLRNDFRRCPR